MSHLREKLNDWTASADGSAGAAQTLTKAAETGNRHWITGLSVEVMVAIDGGAGQFGIELRSGSTRKLKWYMSGAAAAGTRFEIQFPRPIPLTISEAANLVGDDPGTAGRTAMNLMGYTLKG